MSRNRQSAERLCCYVTRDKDREKKIMLNGNLTYLSVTQIWMFPRITKQYFHHCKLKRSSSEKLILRERPDNVLFNNFLQTFVLKILIPNTLELTINEWTNYVEKKKKKKEPFGVETNIVFLRQRVVRPGILLMRVVMVFQFNAIISATSLLDCRQPIRRIRRQYVQ